MPNGSGFADVQFHGRNDTVRWELRVTEVLERLGGTWHRVHRHADPFIDRHEFDYELSLLT